ncbi:MAG: helix-turn-helix transcriptional regulator [Actinobacteria bacterium]|nr:helix-turn-helix transcriptional regulator [Actinomycetota bacterium]
MAEKQAKCINEKSAFSTPATVVIVLGFACYLTCGMVELNPSLYAQPLPEAQAIIDAWSPVSWCLKLLVLFAFVVFSCRRGSLLGEKSLIFATGGVYSFGIALVYLCGWGSTVIPVGLVIGQLCQAASLGFLVLWAELLCASNMRTILLLVAGSYVASFVLCLLLAEFSLVTFIFLTALLPVTSSLLLLSFHSEPKEQISPTPITSLKDLPYKEMLAIGIYGFAFLLANSISEARISVSVEQMTVIAGAVVSLFVIVVLSLIKGRFDFTLFYRLVSPFLVVALLIVLLAENGFQQYESFALGGSWAFYKIITTTIWCVLAMNSTLPSGCVIAAGQIILTLCDRVETPVFWAIHYFGLPQGVVIAIVILVVLLASAFLLNERDFLRPQKNSPLVAQFDTIDEFYTECINNAALRYNLSLREQELSRMVLQGLPSDEIRDKLCIAPGTYKTHMRNIYSKTEVHSRQEFVALLRNSAEDTGQNPNLPSS